MRRRTLLAGVLAVTVSAAPSLARADELQTPAGLWRTFDDHTGKERGTVRIWDEQGVLFGVIVSSRDPADASKLCVSCRDDRANKPVIGLNIIRGLRKDGAQWSGGEILDPETGTVYRCSMHLEDGGRALVVRGYVGISLLGRSQTWVRAS